MPTLLLMSFSFTNWIFKRYPDYFKDTDTYKNTLGEGFFERYTRNFDGEIEENTHSFIRDFLTILVPGDTPRKYLPLLAYTLGDISQVGVEAVDRALVMYGRTLHQIKGTAQSFKFMFNLFGLIVSSIEEDLSNRRAHYDEEIEFDQDEVALYDTSCSGCINVTLTYEHPDDIFTPSPILVTIPIETVNAITKLLCLVTPIDVKVILIRRTT